MGSPPPSRHRPQAALVLLVLLAAGLRLYRIEHQSYWNDEGNSLALARRDVDAIISSAAADIHPPGYYLALKVWRALAGETEFALRSFSAFAGVTLVALLYRLGREYFDARAALAAAFLGAVNPFLIYYAQEARMYSLLAALGAASFLLFSRARFRGIRGWDLGVGYCLVSAFGLYTHYAFAFVVVAQNLAMLGGLLAHRHGYTYTRRRLAAWFSLQAITLALFLPWLPTAFRHLTAWPAGRESHPLLASLADTTRYLAFGRTVRTDNVSLGLMVVAVLLLVGLRRKGQTITPLLWLVVTAGLTLRFGLLTEAFSKFLLVAVPPLCLLLGHGLAASWRWEIRRPWGGGLGISRYSGLGFGILFLALFAASTYASLRNLYFNPAYFRDDYRGIARYVASIERSGDAIITISPNQVEAFGYYHRPEPGSAEVFPLPLTRPLDKAETTQALESITTAHDRLFVLFWGDEQADPERFVEGWLNSYTFKAEDTWYGQVRLATYAAAAPAAEVTAPSGARFGEQITLQGYTLKSRALPPGDILQITLFWQADAALEERYKVFVHLYAARDQPPLAQQDGEPGGGLSPTIGWEPGRRYADNHGVLLPANLPPGEYTLRIGLYHLFDGTRLPVTRNGEEMGDSLELEKITVKQEAP